MEEENPKNQEEKFLENSGLEHAKDVVTIMPTMIDDSMDDREVKRVVGEATEEELLKIIEEVK